LRRKGKKRERETGRNRDQPVAGECKKRGKKKKACRFKGCIQRGKAGHKVNLQLINKKAYVGGEEKRGKKLRGKEVRMISKPTICSKKPEGKGGNDQQGKSRGV